MIAGQVAEGSEPGSLRREGYVDVSVVLPCLNEAPVVGRVVADARRALEAADLSHEIIVADNGSTDDSVAVATAAGATVIHVHPRGYGNAYHGGIEAAQGKVLLMADADGTYPMDMIPTLVRPVLAGESDVVIGSRLRGAVAKAAMPWSHRYIGNPILTGVLNRFFGVTVSDAHSGMRAIAIDAYRNLGLSTPGMEYASEMIVKAARRHLRITEVPIDYFPRVGESKLQTWPDGWRHLKFLLLASPTWLFLLPGAIAVFLGLLILIPLSFGPIEIGPFQLILHPMFIGALLVILGYQAIPCGALVRACSPATYGVPDRLATFLHRRLRLEHALLSGGAILTAGVGIGVGIFVHWAVSGFGPLAEIRLAILALTLSVLGAQTIFGAFLYAFFLPPEFGGGVSPYVGTTPNGSADTTGRGQPRASGAGRHPTNP